MVTADNLFVLYINGQAIGESDVDNSAWHRPKCWDVTDLAIPGRLVVGIEAGNTIPGPAGLLCKLVVELADGSKIVLASDKNWESLFQLRFQLATAGRGRAEMGRRTGHRSAWRSAVGKAPSEGHAARRTVAGRRGGRKAPRRRR